MISNLYLVSSDAAIIVVLLSSLGSLQVFSSSLMGFFQVDRRFLAYSEAASS